MHIFLFELCIAIKCSEFNMPCSTLLVLVLEYMNIPLHALTTLIFVAMGKRRAILLLCCVAQQRAYEVPLSYYIYKRLQMEIFSFAQKETGAKNVAMATTY